MQTAPYLNISVENGYTLRLHVQHAGKDGLLSQNTECGIPQVLYVRTPSSPNSSNFLFRADGIHTCTTSPNHLSKDNLFLHLFFPCSLSFNPTSRVLIGKAGDLGCGQHAHNYLL